MSAIARILLKEGREISGSDRELSPTLDDLRERGAQIIIGHRAENVSGAAALIVTDAVELDTNSETRTARELEIPMLRRSQALGQIVNRRKAIAVTGTHGKSTTSALLTAILADAGFDPFAVIGPAVEGWDGNVRFGNGEFAVVEACEAFDGLHDIDPELVVLTNLEADHLEYHGSLEALSESIANFVMKTTREPRLIYCADDGGAVEIHRRVGFGIPYGFGIAPFEANYRNGRLHTSFGELKLRVPGRHMAYDALGAATAAIALGVDPKAALSSLERAPGCKQRLEVLGEVRGVLVVNDYAHHPSAIAASFEALRESYPERRLVAVHQPHTYTRTRDMRREFVDVLATADVVILTDICPARERPIPGISAALYVEDLEARGIDVHYIPSRHLLPREVLKIVQSGDLVTSFGAGNISSFAPDFLKEFYRENETLRVCVLCGGESAEREVSLMSGLMVYEALQRKGFRVTTLDPNELMLYWGDVHPLIGPDRPDIVFPVMHGPADEDGRVQALLELLHIPYVGSGVEASALAMNKHESKARLAQARLTVPQGVLLRSSHDLPELPTPAVVKPNRQGSTIGLTVVRDAKAMGAAVKKAFKYDDEVVIEELIEGIEISVPVIGDKAFPAVEIVPPKGSYDFEAKYTPGATDEIVPARIPSHIERRAGEIAINAHRTLGLEDFSRTDMIVRGEEIFVLEVNSMPGLTPTSLVPRSAESTGMSYDDLCERVLQVALERYGIEKARS